MIDPVLPSFKSFTEKFESITDAGKYEKNKPSTSIGVTWDFKSYHTTKNFETPLPCGNLLKNWVTVKTGWLHADLFMFHHLQNLESGT
jgi:hypothetical protein